MKKKLLPILLLVLVMVFTGCTNTQLEFWNKSMAIQDWEATKVKGTMNMNMTIQGESIDMVMDMDGLSNTADMSSMVNMSLKTTMPTDETQNIEIKDIKMYLKDGKIAISKNYFTELLKVSGIELPAEFANPEVEYIVLKTDSVEQELLMALAKDKEAVKDMYKMIEDIAKDIGFNVDVAKKDNTYSIDLDQTEVGELVKNAILTATDNLESLNKTFGLGLTEEEIKIAQEEVNSVKTEIDQIVQAVSNLIKGSFKMDYTFEDNKVTQKTSLVVEEPTLTKSKINMYMDTVSTRVEPKEITMPEKVLEVTQSELMELIAGKVVVIDRTQNLITDITGKSADCKVITKDTKTFVPAKTVLGSLGQVVVYDTQAKQVGIKVNDELKVINVISQEGTSYISLDELRALGYNVQEEGNFITIQ